MSNMTLEEIDRELKECESHNTKLAERKQVYAENLKREFGVDSTEELKTTLAEVEKQLAEKNAEYEKALNEAESLLRAAKNPSSAEGASC